MRIKKIIAVLLAVCTLFTATACSNKKTTLNDFIETTDHSKESGKAVYDITKTSLDKTEKDDVHIESFNKDKDNSDMAVRVKSDGMDITLSLKKRGKDILLGADSVIEYLTKAIAANGDDDEEENNISDYFKDIAKESYLSLTDFDEESSNIAKNLNDTISLIKEAYGDYEPIYLSKEKGEYVYKVNKEDMREELRNFSQFTKDNKEKIDKIYSKYSEEVQSIKESSYEIKQKLKQISSLEIHAKKDGIELNMINTDGNITVKYAFDDKAEVKLVDFKGKKLSEEDMQSILIPLMLSGALSGLTSTGDVE